MVDAGADLVVLQGPHVMRGMEFYKGKLIDYSMGNFAGYRRALVSTGVLGISGVLQVTHGRRRLGQGGQAGRHLDWSTPATRGWTRSKRAIAQVASLTRADFPTTGPTIADDGTITHRAGGLRRVARRPGRSVATVGSVVTVAVH